MDMQHDILVTGGAGFIGSHLACSLLDAGHRVTIIDNLDDYYDIHLKKRNLEAVREHGEFEFIHGDILDLELLKKIANRKNIDMIYHNAAQAGVRISVEDPHKPNRTNVEGTLNILITAVEHGIDRIISASSSSVYGKVEYLPFDENHPHRPVSPYGVSKLAAEHYCRVFHEIHDLNVISLRYFTVYGPRMRPDLAISIFSKKALGDEPIEIFGTGKKTRDFTYIDDIVKANLMFLSSSESGVFNIGFGSSIDINGLAEKLIELTNSRSKIIHTGDKKGDAEHTLASVDLLKKRFGWKPITPIDEGLEKFIEYIKENPE